MPSACVNVPKPSHKESREESTREERTFDKNNERKKPAVRLGDISILLQTPAERAMGKATVSGKSDLKGMIQALSKEFLICSAFE